MQGGLCVEFRSGGTSVCVVVSAPVWPAEAQKKEKR